jgi:hypothetical protein
MWVLICCHQVRAQIPKEPVSVTSPNAASLGLYGEVPVSFFTGMPNIELPLHTLQAGKLAVPVSLSYHASGFQPDAHPGWVGMGWNLSAGGAISRSVNDMPDDFNNPNYYLGGNSGYYFNKSILDGWDWFQQSRMQSIARTNEMLKDTEPDEFSFNFLNYTGKFYYTHTGGWQVKCNRPIKVELYSVAGVNQAPNYFLDVPFTAPYNSRANTYGYSKSFAGFTIIGEDGTRYVFGGNTSAMEYSMAFFDQEGDDWVANSWYLTKITHTDGRTVDLAYERDDFINQMYISVSHNVQTRTVSSGGFFNPQPSCSSSSSYPVGASYTGKLVAPVYLTTVQSGAHTIRFDRSTSTELPYAQSAYSWRYSEWYMSATWGSQFLPYLERGSSNNSYPSCLSNLRWKKLDQIRVEYKGQTIKRISLGYNNVATERLTLLSVAESGAGGLSKPAHRFDYNNYHNLPGYLANENDHWGFHNARYASLDYANYYSYRQPSTNSAVYLAGMLTRITYPTGGVTDFEYEQHSYGKQVNEQRNQVLAVSGGTAPAGGVRIRKVSSYSLDAPQQKLEKEYFYVTGYNNTATVSTLPSSGVLGGQVRYYFDDYRANAFNDRNITYSQSIFSSQSVLPACNNSQGSHIGYSEVVEKRSDGGYTRFSYSNFDTGRMDDMAQNTLQLTRTVYQPYSSTEEERGQLLLEEAYNALNQRVKYRQIQYSAINKLAETVRSMKARYFNVCPGTAVSVEEATAYFIYTYTCLPVQESETIYDAEGRHGVTTNKYYTYNSSRLLTNESTYDSKGQLLETRYRYVGDIPYDGPQPYLPVTRGIARMPGLNMVGLPLETVRYRNGQIVGATVVTYSEYNGDKVLPCQVLELETAQPLTTSQYAQTHFGNFNDYNWNYTPLLLDSKLKPKLTFVGYDGRGNPVTIAKPGSVTTSFEWETSLDQPVAVFTNATRTPPIYNNPNIGNEASFLSFESGTRGQPREQEDYWMNLDAAAGAGDPSSDAHSGAFSWRLASARPWDYNFGPTHVFSPDNQTQRYRLSGWVKTEAGFGADEGHLVISVNRADGTYLNTPVSYASTTFGNTQGQWKYVEAVLDLAAVRQSAGSTVPATERLQLVAYCCTSANGAPSGAGVRIDDIRFQPASGEANTYTYDGASGQPSSISGPDGRPASYYFDGLQRLQLVKDHQGNVLQHLQYNYQP